MDIATKSKSNSKGNTLDENRKAEKQKNPNIEHTELLDFVDITEELNSDKPSIK